MSDRIDELLAADARDVGCDATFEVLHAYVESGEEAASRYPGVAVHLRGCPACRADYEGLRAAGGGE
jgi:predicted anti-sigma-YlaC factor YlaD